MLLGLDAAFLRRELDALGADVFHASGVQPETPRGCAVVITFYDPSAFLHPEWHTPDTVRYARAEARMVKRGAGILAISGWAAAQAAGLFGRGSRIGVAGGAADAMFRPGDPDRTVLSRLGLEPGGYLLHVGNFVPRKNIPFLVECHERAVSRGLAAPLVLAGAGGWKRPEIGGPSVRIVEAATDETLLALYRGAMALLLPSLHEGLGLPVLEALACGCGVVASDAAALPETLGGHGILLDPADGPAWTGAMLELEAGMAAELGAMAAGAPRPSWTGVAASAMDFYRSLAG
jgi:alpha-1,3-rhamnosyl/mannosyltransferase